MFRRLLRTWPLAFGLLVAAFGCLWPQQPVWRKPLPHDAALLGFSADGKSVMVFEGVDNVRTHGEPLPRRPALARWATENGSEVRRQPMPSIVDPKCPRVVAGGRYFELELPPKEAVNGSPPVDFDVCRRLYDAETCLPAALSGAVDDSIEISDDGKLFKERRGATVDDFGVIVVSEIATRRELVRVPVFVAEAPGSDKGRHANAIALDGTGMRMAIGWFQDDAGWSLEIVDLVPPQRRRTVALPSGQRIESIGFQGGSVVVDSATAKDGDTVETFRSYVDAATGRLGPLVLQGSHTTYVHSGSPNVLGFCVFPAVHGSGSDMRAGCGWSAVERWRVRKLDSEPDFAKWLMAKLPPISPLVHRLLRWSGTYVALLDSTANAERWRGPLIGELSVWDISPGGSFYTHALNDDSGERWVELYSTTDRWRWPWLLAVPAGFAWWRRNAKRRRPMAVNPPGNHAAC